MDERDIPFSKIEEKSFVDLPDDDPDVNFTLKKAGINKRPHYIEVKDPFTGEPVRLLSNIRVFAELPAGQKGLHMSRIEKGLHKLADQPAVSLQQYGENLLEDVLETQDQEAAAVEITADYEKAVSKNVSDRPSHELMKMHLIAEQTREGKSISIGGTIPFMNSCPCVERWGVRYFYTELKGNTDLDDETAKEVAMKAPLLSHTNKGDATLIIESDKAEFADIYSVVENSSSIPRELLSGEDEFEFVKVSHKDRMFCEDVAREIVKNTVDQFDGKVSEDALVKMKVDVDESIHSHNLVVELEDNFGDIKSELAR